MTELSSAVPPPPVPAPGGCPAEAIADPPEQLGDIEALYERFARPGLALARRIVCDDALAEDVLQEVLLACWRNPAAFDPTRGSLSGWVMALVHHKAVDAVRRENSRRGRLLSTDVDPPGSPLLGESTATSGDGRDAAERVCERAEAARVRAALAALPHPQRQALTLAYYGGYTQQQIAMLTATPLGTVKTRMLAGIRRLHALLAPPSPPAPLAG